MASKFSILTLATGAAAFNVGPVHNSKVASSHFVRRSPEMSVDNTVAKNAAASAAALCFLLGATDANAITKSEWDAVNYLEMKGTTLSNRCFTVDTPTDGGEIKVSGKKVLNDICIEPKTFLVAEESFDKKTGKVGKDYVKTKVMTRETYSLFGVSGKLENNGGLKFTENDGIDYAATTVQLPGGERVPFLFTVKELFASSPDSSFKQGTTLSGKFTVPSYRTGAFLDPKGRGMYTGYDQAQALPALQAGQDDPLAKENNKVFDVLPGEIEFKVTDVDPEASAIGGVFVSSQPSDTDLGSKEPKELLIKGAFYAHVGDA